MKSQLAGCKLQLAKAPKSFGPGVPQAAPTLSRSSGWIPVVAALSRSKQHHLLTQTEIRPNKIRYYVEKRDPDFDCKMARSCMSTRMKKPQSHSY